MSSNSKLIVPALVAVVALLAGCSNANKREAKYLQRGIALFDQGDYEKARLEFRNAGGIKPTDPEVRYRLGLVDEAEGEIRNAFVNFMHASEQDPHYRLALLKLAQYYLSAQVYDQAESRIQTVLADHPDDAEGHALQAAVLLRQQHLDEAEKEGLLAIGKDPKSVNAISVLTGVYLAKNDPARATEVLESGIARDPKEASLLQVKVAVYQKLNNIPKIEEAYQALFKLKPQERRFRESLAQLYVQNNRLDDAEAALRAGVAAMPDDWAMRHTLVAFLSEKRGLDAAEKEIRNNMKEFPDHDEQYLWLADVYMQFHAVDRAVALLEEIVARDKFEPQGLNARNSLARISFARGDRSLGEKLVEIVLEKDPTNQDALFMRAGMAYDAGRYQSAVSDLRSILREHPKAKESLQLLAEALLHQGHVDLAIDTLSQLVDVDPLNSGARVRLAQMYHLNGDSKRAMTLLAQVTKIDPKYPIGWESTARIAIDMKDWDTANAAIEKLAGLGDEKQSLSATFLRGQVSVGNGRLDEANRYFTQVVTVDPGTPLAEHALAAYIDASRHLGHIEAAAHFIETLKTDSPYVAIALGECYAELGKYDEANKQFDQLIDAKSLRPEPYLDRARVALREKNADKAVEVLKRGYELIPSDGRIPMMLGDVLGAEKRYQEAISVYEDLLARNPDLVEPANNVAELIADYEYTDPVALEKARQYAERFHGASNPLLLDTLGWVYYRQGATAQAVTVLERALSIGDVPPQVHYHYGLILLKADRKADAKTQLQMAVKDGANYPGLDDAQNILKSL